MTSPPRRPSVRLLEVSITGADDADAVLAAVRDAVAASVPDRTTTTDAVRSAVASSVAEASRP